MDALQNWMDELSWIFACWCKLRKVTDYFNNFWVVVLKDGSETLIYKELMNLADFLHAHIYSGKLKVTLIVSWVYVLKYGCDFFGPGTLKSASCQVWIKLFFCMLEVM